MMIQINFCTECGTARNGRFCSECGLDFLSLNATAETISEFEQISAPLPHAANSIEINFPVNPQFPVALDIPLGIVYAEDFHDSTNCHNCGKPGVTNILCPDCI